MSGDSSHYFTTPAAGPVTTRDLDVVLAGRDLTLRTAAGVFSSDHIDLGTRVLLREVPDPPFHGDLLDLGCGWGPLAITAALRAPQATVWAVDVNKRALELTAANARIAGCGNVRAVLPQDVPDDVRFAAIWSNPPIRVGKAELHGMLLHWLPRLEPGALAHLVVQRHLGADSLQAWLAEALPAAGLADADVADADLAGAGQPLSGWSVRRAGSAKGYRVLAVAAPESGGTEVGGDGSAS
jgi:16S rRNA G1207 methylase RsmC